MKKFILILSATALFAACKQKNLTDSAAYQQQLDSLNQVQQQKQQQTYPTTVVTKPVYRTRTRTVYRSYPAYSTPTQKHGMRRSTKNALIGAGVGAVTGAVISHKVGGAVIGGAVGAGAGYLYGKHREKKYGKYRH